jgi:hypothetical protein
LAGAVRQTVVQKMQCRNLPGWSLFSKARRNTNKWFQLASLCLSLVLVFQIIACYDGNFINDDPPSQTSQSSIDLTSHHIEARLIKYFAETIYLSVIGRFNFCGFDVSPPVLSNNQ